MILPDRNIAPDRALLTIGGMIFGSTRRADDRLPAMG